MISKTIFSNISNILRGRYVNRWHQNSEIYLALLVIDSSKDAECLKNDIFVFIFIDINPCAKYFPQFDILLTIWKIKPKQIVMDKEMHLRYIGFWEIIHNNKRNLTIHLNDFQRPSYGLRRKNLLPYPPIDVIDKLSLNNFLPSNFKTVKHGDYEFTECMEGFVHIYATAYQYNRDPKALAGYSVYYGSGHPL